VHVIFVSQEFRDEEFKTKNMLCMPIFNNEKKIIGVTQLVNKLNGVPFNENDANIIEVMSLHYSA
jgi:dual 3',5'-cyclic-AMP and -GMP phosphodiesterase 11